jgi:DNA-binding transcriptional regulator YhcF (GntR family)
VGDELITTSVDDLLELLKTVSKISLAEAAQKLKVNQNTVQAWIDFLVEEEIVGIEYKFTKPLIYLNKTPKFNEVRVIEEENFTISKYKEDFLNRAKQRGIPVNKVEFFWQNHISQIINSKKDFFYREARKRRITDIDNIWNEYMTEIIRS